MHRFFIPPTWIEGRRVSLKGEVARQVNRVLRMAPGDEIMVLDNSGKEYTVRLTDFARDAIEGEVLFDGDGKGEPTIGMALYQGMLKGDKLRWVLQKGTELGVSRFVPLVCKRSVPRGQEGWDSSRYPRWSKIVSEAAEQSGRCLLPQVNQPMAFRDACKAAAASGVSILPWEREGAKSLRAALRKVQTDHVNIFIGPEGGFEAVEVAEATSWGVTPVSLGRRILRSETAAIATIAAVLYDCGELGGG